MTAQEFGALLKARREAKGLTVEELAARIKLSARTLRSIEDGSMDGLPHAVYARGFVRSYAQLIGLEKDEIDEGLDSVFPLPSGHDAHPLPGPIDRQRNKGRRSVGDKFIALIIVLVLLVLPVTGGWFIVTRYGDSIIEWVKQPFIAAPSEPRPEAFQEPPLVDDNTVEPADSAENGGQTPQSAQESAPPGAGEPADSPLAGISGTEQELPPASGETTTSPATPASSSTALAQIESSVAVPEATPAPGEHTLQIAAQQACWVRVQADGANVRSFEMKQGETSFWPFKRSLELTLGNAGGVTIRYNGQPYALNARSGEVKTVQFPPR